jgi:hypothetical protein
LDGKNTFHATQMAAWQRGIGNGLQLDKLLPSSREILQIPPELDIIVPTNVLEYQNRVQGLESMAYTQQLLNQDHTCLEPG